MSKNIFTAEDISAFNIKNDILHAFLPVVPHDFKDNHVAAADIHAIAEVKAQIDFSEKSEPYHNHVMDEQRFVLKSMTVIKLYCYEDFLGMNLYISPNTQLTPYDKGCTFPEINSRFILSTHGHDTICNTLFPTLSEAELRVFGDPAQPTLTIKNKLSSPLTEETMDLELYKTFTYTNITNAGAKTEEQGCVIFKPCIDANIQTMNNGIVIADKVVPICFFVDKHRSNAITKPWFDYKPSAKSPKRFAVPEFGVPIWFKFGSKFFLEDRINARDRIRVEQQFC